MSSALLTLPLLTPSRMRSTILSAVRGPKSADCGGGSRRRQEAVWAGGACTKHRQNHCRRSMALLCNASGSGPCASAVSRTCPRHLRALRRWNHHQHPVAGHLDASRRPPAAYAAASALHSTFFTTLSIPAGRRRVGATVKGAMQGTRCCGPAHRAVWAGPVRKAAVPEPNTGTQNASILSTSCGTMYRRPALSPS